MSYLFISHSSQNNFEAIALHDWLLKEGWDELFLDLDPTRGIAAGERWEKALHDAAHRCDAVLFLVSKAWLDSEWCRKEFRLAHRLNKRIIGLLIEDLPIGDLPNELTATWQLVNLASGQDHSILQVMHPQSGEQQHVHFSQAGLAQLRNGLVKAGLDPRFFEWPPAHDAKRPPYRGMRPLEMEDAGIFFGREAPTIDLLARLRGLREDPPPRFLAILGASGAGKSSFLRAGILPRLHRDERQFLPLPIIRPEASVLWGDDGLLASLSEASENTQLGITRKKLRDAIESDQDELTTILNELAQKAAPPDLESLSSANNSPTPPTLIMSIDQGEELFQSEGSDEAKTFLQLLHTLTNDQSVPLIVLFTIRSDAYEQLQTAKALEGIQQQTFSLAPMPKGAFQAVIEGPAARLKGSERELIIEAGLTERLLEDIEKGGSKDSLPLLAFTLERLYLDYGQDGDLRLDEYHDMGGIEGAIEAAVERSFSKALKDPSLPNERQALQNLLRRGLIPWLAGIDPDTQAPRRRVAKLSEIPAEAQPMIKHLIEQRLLATDVDEDSNEVTLEPAHEALLRQWGLLKGWLQEDFAALSSLEALQRASRDWEANKRAKDWLNHTAGRLEDAENLKQREDLARFLHTADWDYLAECRQLEDHIKNKELEEAKKLAQSQKRVAQRTKVGLVIALVLMTVSGILGWQAWEKSEIALQQTEQKQIEREKALLTQSYFLMTLAEQSNEKGDYEKALLLALNAIPGLHGGERPLPDYVSPLLEASRKQNNLTQIDFNRSDVFDGQALHFGTLSSNDRWLIVASKAKNLYLANVHTGLIRDMGKYSEQWQIDQDVFSPDGNHAVIVRGESVHLVDVASLEDQQVFMHEADVYSVSFSPSGHQILASSLDGQVTQWDTKNGKKIRIFHATKQNNSNIGWKNLRDFLFRAKHSNELNTIRFMNRETNQTTFLDVLKSVPHNLDFVLHILKTTSDLLNPGRLLSRLIYEENLLGGLRRINQTYVPKPRTHGVFSPNGAWILTRPSEKRLSVWDSNTGELLREIVEQHSVNRSWISPDSQLILTVLEDSTLSIWRARTGEMLRTLNYAGQNINSISFSHDSKAIVVTFHDDATIIQEIFTDTVKLADYRIQGTTAKFSPNDLEFLVRIDNWRSSTIEIWNDKTGRKHQYPTNEPIVSADYSESGRTIYVVTSGGTANFWALTSKPLLTISEENHTFETVSTSPDSTMLLTTSSKENSDIKTAEIWDSYTGKKLHSLPHESLESLESAIFSTDGKTIITFGKDINFWNPLNGKKQNSIIGESDFVYVIAINDRNSLALMKESSGIETLCDLETGDKYPALGVRFNSYSIAIGANKIFVAQAAVSKKKAKDSNQAGETVKGTILDQQPEQETAPEPQILQTEIVDALTGEVLLTLDIKFEEIEQINVSPNDQYLAIVTHDNALNIWNMATSDLKLKVEHEAYIRSFAFTPDSSAVAFTSRSELMIWDITSGKTQQIFKHPEEVTSFVFNPDGKILYTNTEDEGYLWSVSNREIILTIDADSAVLSPNGEWLFSIGTTKDNVRSHKVPQLEAIHLYQIGSQKLIPYETCFDDQTREAYWLRPLTKQEKLERGCGKNGGEKYETMGFYPAIQAIIEGNTSYLSDTSKRDQIQDTLRASFLHPFRAFVESKEPSLGLAKQIAELMGIDYLQKQAREQINFIDILAQTDVLNDKELSEFIGWLMSNGYSAVAQDSKGETLGHILARYNQAIALQYLLSAGIDINLKNSLKKSFLIIASESGALETVSVLLNADIDINSIDYFGSTALVRAIKADKINVVKQLLASGASASPIDVRGRTALHAFARNITNISDREARKMVSLLVDSGADIDAQDENGLTALYSAASSELPSNFSILTALLLNGANQEIYSSLGHSPLMVAINNGHKKIAEKLIETGANMTHVSNFEQTPLHIASYSHNDSGDRLQAEISDLLFKAGVPLDAKNEDGKTALHLALDNRLPFVVTSLINNGADTQIEDNLGYNIFYNVIAIQYEARILNAAFETNSDQVIKSYLSELQKPGFPAEEWGYDQRDGNGNNIAHLMITSLDHDVAYKQYFSEILQTWVNLGVDLNQTNNNGETPISLAFRKGYVNVLDTLIAKGADVNLLGNQTLNFHNFIETLTGDIVNTGSLRSLIDKLRLIGIGVNQLNADDKTPLMLATERGYLNVVRTLIEAGSDVNYTGRDGMTLVLRATLSGHDKIARHLISSGADLHGSLEKYFPDIHSTKDNDSLLRVINAVPDDREPGEVFLKLLNDLVSKGLDIDQQNDNGETPLMQAIRKGSKALTNSLLELGANPDIVNNIGGFALLYAVHFGHIDIIKQLIKTKANVNLIGWKEYDSLGLTTFKESHLSDGLRSEIAAILIEAGADINYIDDQGYTTAFEAVKNNYPKLLKTLLHAGARIDIPVQALNNITALDLAREMGNSEIIALLDEASTKQSQL